MRWYAAVIVGNFAGRRNAFNDLQDLLRDVAVLAELLAHVRELLALRQAAVPEDENRLLEGGLCGEVGDVEARVEEATRRAVDEADVVLVDVDAVQAFADRHHGPGSPACKKQYRLISCASTRPFPTRGRGPRASRCRPQGPPPRGCGPSWAGG